MNQGWASVLAGLVAACGAAAGAIVERWRHHRVDEAIADRTSVETAERVVELLREQLERQQAELDDARNEIRRLREQVADLQALVATIADPRPGGQRRTDPPG